MLTVAPLGPLETNDLEKGLETVLMGMRTGLPDVKATTKKYGTINGLKFLRAEINGTKLGRKLQGLMYIAVDGRVFLALMFVDIDPYHLESLKLGETIAATIRKG
jgi:hypothetical protein